ncbi:Sip1-related alpha-galactosidase [Ilumatobacter sp.]|uniref:Sip1-related alpha-galactosidase n=1 Tax=Ilumatobacter sp. TaxID=1967498 RepID=UPI003B527B21
MSGSAGSALLGEHSSRPAPGVTVSAAATSGLAADAVIEITAERDLSALATGRFSSPSVGVSWGRSDLHPRLELLGFAFTQFALPVVAGPELDFDFRPAPGLRSPRAVTPLVARADGVVVLVAPVDSFHEQIVAIDDDGLVAGWHGDLDDVPAGFRTRMGLYEGRTVAGVLDRWSRDLGVDQRRRRRGGALTTHLSYWTDNGAAYWYRTEPGRTIATSVAEAVERLRADDVPVRAIELDSWFYDHEVPRPIAEIGYPHEVPPTGTRSWTPRADAFDRADGLDPGEDERGGGAAPGSDVAGDALERFADRLGRPPLVLHARHVSPRSPDVDGGWWVDEHAAFPRDPGFFRRWFADAARWGATCIEQDWMLMYWFGVRAMRSAPGRAAAWQRALDEQAASSDLDLVWCMATPADMVLAASLERVVAVRTCDDYRFARDPAVLWTWFLTVNRLAGALGLVAFKDCFFSNADVDDGDDDIDGDPHAELEAALAALSGGPVGIGDRIGRTDRDVVMRTCDDDGRLRRVDRPIGAIDDCLFGAPARGERLMWATTTTTDEHDRVWTTVLAINVDAARRTVTDSLVLADVAGSSTIESLYDWRARTARRAPTDLELTLEPHGWSLHVIGPSGAPDAGSVGDPDRYVVVESIG